MKVTVAYLHELVDRLEKAIAANRATPGRKGSVVHLTPEIASDCMVVGDLHGNRIHFNRVLKAADLENKPRRHLVLQEVIHGGPTYPNGGCMSHIMLEDVADLKTKFPDRFHFLLANHEVGQFLNQPLTKGGVSQNHLFDTGIAYSYGPAADRIVELFKQFILTCPLAIRLKNGVFISHSLPDREKETLFDPRVLMRDLEEGDLLATGKAYPMIWGRNIEPARAKQFAAMVKSTVLINGHEPTLAGWSRPSPERFVLDASGKELFAALVRTDGPVSPDQVEKGLLHLTGSEGETTSGP